MFFKQQWRKCVHLHRTDMVVRSGLTLID